MTLSPFALALESFWGSLDSKQSRRGYRSDWGRYWTWLLLEGVADPLDAKPADVQRYVSQLADAKKKKSTRAHALSVIRSVYDYLVVNGLLEYNPARSVKNPRVSLEPTTPFLDAEALKKLLVLPPDRGGEYVDDWRARRDRLCLLLLVGIGWRRSEIARLQVGDVQGGVVTGVVKGGKKATTGIPEWLQREIEIWIAWAELEGPLLPRCPESEHSISDSTVYDIVVRAGERAGIENVTPHALRRTFITILRERGVDLKTLQLAVAHVSSQTTERYDRAREIGAPGDLLEDLVGRPRRSI